MNQWNSLNQLSQLAIEPKSKADQDKMGTALQNLQKKILLSELILIKKLVKQSSLVWVNFTLIFIVDRMRREFKVEANVGAPQVAYRETFRAVCAS